MFAVPLLTVLLSLFLLTCCLLLFFRKLVALFGKEEEAAAEDPSGELDMVRALRQVRGAEERQAKMLELVELLFERLPKRKFSEYK